jgi:hypothetical protein
LGLHLHGLLAQTREVDLDGHRRSPKYRLCGNIRSGPGIIRG